MYVFIINCMGNKFHIVDLAYSLLRGSHSYFIKPVPVLLLHYTPLGWSPQSLPPSSPEALKGQQWHVQNNLTAMDKHKSKKKHAHSCSLGTLIKAIHALRGNKQTRTNRIKDSYFSLICTKFF